LAEAITNPVTERTPRSEALAGAVSRAVRVRVGPLLLAVLVAGMSDMALEMTASRLLAPRFGSSLFIWAQLIGLVMIYLTAGYTLGGRLADRYPSPRLLYGMIVAAGAWIGLLPLVAVPVLDWASNFPDPITGTTYGAILGIVLLFLVPVTLLGAVSPFAIRLRMREVDASGNTAGSVYALSTLGSILGTFVPVFVLLPYLGIAQTLFVTAAVVVLTAGAGLLSVRGAAPVPERAVQTATPAAAERAAAPARAVRAAEAQTGGVWVLSAVVFVGGMVTMGLEMTASQLLRPYFGSSLFIWANLIGLVMIYLTVGYYLGGRLADRYPRTSVLYGMVAAAGLAAAVIPLLARPILSWSLEAFAEVSVSLFYGSLAGVIALFAIPMILLGCISPFAIRLRMSQVDAAGETAGSVYALSTLGSLLGTLVPAFFLLPTIGSARTLYLGAGALLIVATLGLLVTRHAGARVVAVAVLAVVALFLLPPSGLIKPPPYGTLLAEQESVYNYIQVVQQKNGDIHLVLNEGHAIHSVYRADQSHPLTGGPWDYWLVAPYVNADMRPDDVHNMLMLGSAAGTAAGLFTDVYGPRPVDNVEIDPAVVQMGRQYFHLDEPNVNNIIQDARAYLRTTDKKYSIIGIDAYRQPYIPFHLTTREFFEEVRDKLEPNGVVMINAGRTATDYRLVDAIAATMRTVYPHVYTIDVAGTGNTMVIGSMQGDGLAHFQANAATIHQPLLQQVFAVSLDPNIGKMREFTPADAAGHPVFTDDRAPVEEVIDQLILSYVTGQ
jgi:spermidine synthase